MKQRAASPDVLVDLGDLEELRRDRDRRRHARARRDGHVRGRSSTSSEVDVARPILAEVVATIADVQVRNRGTVGGNVCSNDPTNHLPPLFAALGATFTIQGTGGVRWVAADDFFLGVYMTAVGEGELLTKISVPAAGHARRRLRGA